MVLSLGSNHYAMGIPGPYGAKYNYMLYPDTEKPDTYYVLPETPTYMPRCDGTPSFNMIWWYGGGETEGGIWTFTVALPLPDLKAQGVRDALTSAINEDLAAKDRSEQLDKLARAYAETPPNQALIDDCLKVLDINDDEGRGLTRSFDPKKGPEQFRQPTKQNLTFLGVQLKSGTVTVQGFKSSAD